MSKRIIETDKEIVKHIRRLQRGNDKREFVSFMQKRKALIKQLGKTEAEKILKEKHINKEKRKIDDKMQ